MNVSSTPAPAATTTPAAASRPASPTAPGIDEFVGYQLSYVGTDLRQAIDSIEFAKAEPANRNGQLLNAIEHATLAGAAALSVGKLQNTVETGVNPAPLFDAYLSAHQGVKELKAVLLGADESAVAGHLTTAIEKFVQADASVDTAIGAPAPAAG